MGATLRPPYTAPRVSLENSDDIEGAIPSARRREPDEQAAKTLPRTGATRNVNAPIATTTCATHSARASNGADVKRPLRRGAAAQPPDALHTEKSDTIPAAALASTPADAATASMLFTSAIAAPEDAAMEHHSSQNSGHVAHSKSVRLDESRPRRGGCSIE